MEEEKEKIRYALHVTNSLLHSSKIDRFVIQYTKLNGQTHRTTEHVYRVFISFFPFAELKVHHFEYVALMLK